MKDNLPSVAAPDLVPGQEDPGNLTSGRLLARNAVWNLLGMCSPALVAVVCLPILKRVLGTDRLGIISLAWVIVGYFGFFDLGLSRALTKLVAEKLGQKRVEEIPTLVWASVWMMAGIGLAGSVTAVLLSHWLVTGPLRVPQDLQHEALISFYWLSLSIPFVVVTAGLRGALEALQRFRLATAIRIPMSVFTYLGPVAVLPFSHNLVPIMIALVLGRVAACLAHFWGCFSAWPALRKQRSFHRSCVGPLVRFGGWLTVSNIVAPLLVSCDRFVIGSLISVSAVAYYAVPYEVVTRFNFLAGALVGVLFPAFSTTAESDRNRLVFLYECGLKYIFLALFPVTLVVVAFAPDALRLWLGSDFAHNSTHLTQLLAIAIFLNGLSQIPFAHIQGAGRPDLTAKFHLMELPLYAAALIYFARIGGITGVAAAWLLRVSLDAALLFFVSWRMLPENRFIVTKLPLMSLGALGLFAYAASANPVAIRAAFAVVVCALATYATWKWLISPAEKRALSGLRASPALAWARRRR